MNGFLQKLVLLPALFLAVSIKGQAQNAFFTDAVETSFRNPAQKRVIIPGKYRTLQLNKTGLLSFLARVPDEKRLLNRNAAPLIELPMPNGGTARFRIWESQVMDPRLAAKYPDIHCYTGQGIDDPTANIKLDFTPFGFHAMILSSVKGAVFIDPYAQGNTTNYLSYNKTDFRKSTGFRELAPLYNRSIASRPLSPEKVLATCGGTQLRTYRLALAATAEYTAATGGTVAAAQAAQATTINRVNGVYEREVTIRMVLVANNDLLIYTNATSDPYSNNDGNSMLDENQKNINTVIGNANYDIGHVFSTGGGGIAGLSVVCTSDQKAYGVTGSPVLVGDPFDIDYVAHEMGHQFGASHSFNSETDACGGGNATTFSNAEPGSGSTIMGYAGICGSDNLQLNSDAQFHAVSYDEISIYTTVGTGNNCAVKTATGNIPPTVNAGADFTIPKSTPFSLLGSGTDANGDVLTYSWEQVDVGGPLGSWDNPSGNAPIFRSFVPASTPTRFFPKIADVINNTTVKGEILPSYARTMHFRLTARDNRAGGGGICSDETAITVSGTAGPFVVTYPNTAGLTWLVNDFKTITWDPAGTEVAPISCANVKIELSIDGGLSYPVTLLASTPNDGREEIQVPNNVTTKARIRITAVGNIFYDISNINFTIQQSTATEFVFNNPVPQASCSATSLVATLKTAAFNNFSTSINLNATGVPAGATVSFNPNTVAPGNSSIVTLNNTANLANGTYNITVTGVAGAVTKTRIIPFLVNTIPAVSSNLTVPASNATGIAVLPVFNWSAVAGAGFYTLEISTSNTFNPIAQTISNITTLYRLLTTPLNENTVYYWRITPANSCGSGPVSSTGIFKTGISTCKNSTDVPKTIDENGSPEVTSLITIPELSGVTISDLNVVGLAGNHAYLNDLTISLTSPAGTTVVLFDQICPGGAENLNINLDDEAPGAIPCPPSGNQTARPENPLSAFDGENSSGVWTLTVKDNYDQDGGSLTGWGLTINDCAFIATPITSTPWAQLCPPAANTTLTSNLSGTVYKWQVNTGNGFVDVTNNANYTGATTATLQIFNAPSSWNGYQYRCVVDGNNSTVFTLGFANFWSGAVSNAWENAANWSCNRVPDANTDVIINTGTVVVNSNAVCRSLLANSGSMVTVNTGFKVVVMH